MATMPATSRAVAATATAGRAGRFRWIVCGLLLAAAAINYVDRQIIGILKPTLQSEFGWTEIDYGDIVFAFQLAYAIGFVCAGRLMDRLGTRVGFSLALVIWSLAAMAHAEAVRFGPAVAAVLGAVGLTYSASVAGFIAARFVLGLGESGNFPASIKTVAEWFPRRERALATGIFNAGTNIGALVTPLIVPWVTWRFGWYWAFLGTGALGFAWLVLWWLLYDQPDRHPRVNDAELADGSSFFRTGRRGPSPSPS
jgi:MFS transporter, ACS family, aldohexuronate transporter